MSADEAELESVLQRILTHDSDDFSTLAEVAGLDLLKDLQGADLSGATLDNLDLSGADLRWTRLVGSSLRQANLQRASLVGADLRNADLRDADLSFADLRQAKMDSAIVNDRTRLNRAVLAPHGFHELALSCQERLEDALDVLGRILEQTTAGNVDDELPTTARTLTTGIKEDVRSLVGAVLSMAELRLGVPGRERVGVGGDVELGFPSAVVDNIEDGVVLLDPDTAELSKAYVHASDYGGRWGFVGAEGESVPAPSVGKPLKPYSSGAGKKVAKAVGAAAAVAAAGVAAVKAVGGGKRSVYEVMPRDEGWVVKQSGSARATSMHGTKNEALSAGRQLASRMAPSTLKIYGIDGRIADTRTYKSKRGDEASELPEDQRGSRT